MSLTATATKEFFQYRCPRQLRYALMDSAVRRALPIAENTAKGAWAREGVDYEELVVAKLAKSQTVLRPELSRKLDIDQTLSFLRRNSPQLFAAQLRLSLPAGSPFYAIAGLPKNLTLAEGFADLVEAVFDVGQLVAFRLIDIKAVQHATLFHRMQLAFYALMLRTMLVSEQIQVPVHAMAQVWHARPRADGEVEWQVSQFQLKGYEQQVLDFLQRTVPRVAAVRVDASQDDTEFHLYFKCEQCKFLPHCCKAIAANVPPAQLDLSAVPGMTLHSKRTLGTLGITTIGQLAASESVHRDPRANWSLRTQGETLRSRAQAIIDNSTSFLQRRYTHLMPQRVDLAIHLVVDADPVEGRLAALGCLIERGGELQWHLQAIRERGNQAERDALAKVLLAVVQALDEADSHNAAQPPDPLIAHVFVYEPSEAVDLAEALGRHLSDDTVRSALLHMLRMFPPEDFAPEPEYRGVPHLPATALRSVVETLLATPARVSHDLAAVTRVLATTASPPLSHPYQPAQTFARPFSSRLNIDICRQLKEGTVATADVERDMKSRLLATSALTRWLIARNFEADPQFLRLRKEPFRWQQQFNPMGSADLELLTAHELLDSKTRELAALTALAAPWELRRDRLRCFAKLRLIEWGESPARFAELRLRFLVPPESSHVELDRGSVGLILTNDDPDLRLDPTAWTQVFAQLVDLKRSPGAVEVVVDVECCGRLWDQLLAQTPDDGWFLDQAYRDLNGSRMEAFLNYLSGSSDVGGVGTT